MPLTSIPSYINGPELRSDLSGSKIIDTISMFALNGIICVRYTMGISNKSNYKVASSVGVCFVLNGMGVEHHIS